MAFQAAELLGFFSSVALKYSKPWSLGVAVSLVISEKGLYWLPIPPPPESGLFFSPKVLSLRYVLSVGLSFLQSLWDQAPSSAPALTSSGSLRSLLLFPLFFLDEPTEPSVPRRDAFSSW